MHEERGWSWMNFVDERNEKIVAFGNVFLKPNGKHPRMKADARSPPFFGNARVAIRASQTRMARLHAHETGSKLIQKRSFYSSRVALRSCSWQKHFD